MTPGMMITLKVGPGWISDAPDSHTAGATTDHPRAAVDTVNVLDSHVQKSLHSSLSHWASLLEPDASSAKLLNQCCPEIAPDSKDVFQDHGCFLLHK